MSTSKYTIMARPRSIRSRGFLSARSSIQWVIEAGVSSRDPRRETKTLCINSLRDISTRSTRCGQIYESIWRFFARDDRATPVAAPMPGELIKTHKQFTNSFFVVIYSYCERFAFSRSSCARWGRENLWSFWKSRWFYFSGNLFHFCAMKYIVRVMRVG